MFELNEHTRAILGRPNFACAGIAARLRTLGHTIGTKAEDEQAAAIHFLLTVYETHGNNWAEVANVILKGEAKPAITVILNGKSVMFDAAFAEMDEAIVADMTAEQGPIEGNEQAFIDSYCRSHAEKYGTPFEIA